MKKFIAQGQMEESKVILGWLVNISSLLIQLPPNKHQKWTKDVSSIISQPRDNNIQLEVLIGHLVHTAKIIPTQRHFLSRLHHALMRSTKHSWTCLRLSEKIGSNDIIFRHGRKGFSINNVVFRNLNKI